MSNTEKIELEMIMKMKIFGDLRVDDYTEHGWWLCKSRDKTSYKWYSAALCTCKACGRTDFKVRLSDLLTGKVTHCGCKSDISKTQGLSTSEKIEYILKNKFGKLNPIKYIYSPDTTKKANKRHLVVCRCDCGNECTVNMYNLLGGGTTSCGCSGIETRSIMAKIKNLSYIGTKVNKWSILDLTTDGRDHFYTCKCICGNIRSVNVHNIQNGKSRDCGCGRKKTVSKMMSVSETGNKYGMVTVGELYGKNAHEKSIYICDCDCGRQNVLINVASLKNSSMPSCGCLSRSEGEKAIFDFLLSHNIDFQLEATFDGLEYQGNKLRFDFYLKEYNLCIEYDGIFHFEDKPIYMGKTLEYTEVRDKIKDKFCEDNRIDLLRIPYWDFNKIKDILTNKLGI